VIGSFVIGAIVGGAAMYFYGGQIRDYVDQTTRGAREKAADTLHAAAGGLQSATDTARQRIESAAETARPADARSSTSVEPGRRAG
jgi:hypothetical protein